jgi:hypothetical protein
MRRSGPLPLPSLRGEVHRFSGVVDRFGSFSRNGETEHTICIRNLRLADRDQDLDLDHWWFRLREVWTEAGVRVGDSVLFTAKVQRCSKGYGDPASATLHSRNDGSRLREQVVGFGTCPRSVVVLRRRQPFLPSPWAAPAVWCWHSGWCLRKPVCLRRRGAERSGPGTSWRSW